MRLSVALVPLILVVFVVVACQDGTTAGTSTSESAGPSHPVAPASAVVARPGGGAGAAEALAGRELDPFSLPADLHAASGPLTPSTVSLPVDETYGGSAGFAFRITQEGSGNGGWFRIRSPSSVNRMALLATHTGDGIAARAINNGTGRAFWAQIPEPSNPFPALVATHVGSGEAIRAINFGNGPAVVGRAMGTSTAAGSFQVDNPSSSADALVATSNGNAFPPLFKHTNPGLGQRANSSWAIRRAMASPLMRSL